MLPKIQIRRFFYGLTNSFEFFAYLTSYNKISRQGKSLNAREPGERFVYIPDVCFMASITVEGTLGGGVKLKIRTET